MSRDYITGYVRLHGGPAPGTGEEDIQISEAVDLIFGDNEELKFGDAADVAIKWDASNLTILPLTNLTGAIQIGNGTLSMDFKVFGTVAANYIEYDASADVLNVVAATVTISGEHHALSVIHTGTLSSGEGIVGVNVVVTPKGTAGQWASAFFGNTVLTDANDPIPGTGYASGAEFGVDIGSGCTPCDVGILTLNDGVSCAHYAGAAYIRLMKYGSTWPINLFNFYHEDLASAFNSGRMVVETAGTPAANQLVRCIVGGADMWLLATDTLPGS